MLRATLSIGILAAMVLPGCGKVVRENVAAPESSGIDHRNSSTEDIVVYGKLVSDDLGPPTEVYDSAFGDGYCMSEHVAFEVQEYIRGRGPDRIDFTQQTFNDCNSLADEIGFGEAILFLSRNEYRGTWSEGGVRVGRVEGEASIVFPTDIALFSSFERFDELLSSHDEPFEFEEPKTWDSYEILEELARRDVLDFEVSRRRWPETPTARRDESQSYDEVFLVRMRRYIKVESLLDRD